MDGHRWTTWLIASAVCAASLSLLSNRDVRGEQSDGIDFEAQIAPLLEARCLRCHNEGNAKGDLSLATVKDLVEAGYVTAGEPDASYLLDVLTPIGDEFPAMPKEGDPLSEDEVALVRAWIEQGAAWPEGLVLREVSKADESWWSLQPIERPAVPHVENLSAAWQVSPIDHFVAAKLAEQGLPPNPPADRRSLIRRVTYDLTGLPPTPGEVRAFLNDKSPHAYERLVDRLLASPHYGEQWGRHWLDVVRFGESTGFEQNTIIEELWPFRDYVIRSFNEDKPIDRLIQEHLAGDVLAPGDPAVEVGTAFLVCGPYDAVKNQDPQQAAQIRANTIDEMIRATSESFLGLTIGCTRCHDHKFDPIAQADYYRLYATFAGVHHGLREIATPAEREARRQRIEPLKQQLQQLKQQSEEVEAQVRTRLADVARRLEPTWQQEQISRYLTEDQFEPVKARFVRLIVDGNDDNPTSPVGFGIDEFEVWTAGEEPSNVALAENGAVARGESRVAEDFAAAYSATLTIDGKFGRRWLAAGSELTIELPQTHEIARICFSSDRLRELDSEHNKTRFVGEYRIVVSQDGRRWSEVASSADRQPVSKRHREHRLFNAAATEKEQARLAKLQRRIQQIEREVDAIDSPVTWWAGQFEEISDPTHVFLGGDPQRPGKQVFPASLSFVSTDPYRLTDSVPGPQRRRALAQWLTSPNNPLTPRVLANRLWHYHFGTGIVSTPSDFGYMGDRPSHPQLLDWLALQVLEHGWRLKPLHKQIVMSQAYRQSSQWREEAARIDGDNRLLWRFSPRRLTAEEVRDTILSIAGKLDPQMGGPGFRLYRYIRDNVATYIPLDEHGPETYRRAVYHQNARAARVDLMTDFDCPDPAFAAPRRASTTTPLQALTLLNHDFSLDMADALAGRLQRESPDDVVGQVRRGFRLAFSRKPTQQELDSAAALIQEFGLAAFCRALLNSNELIYLD